MTQGRVDGLQTAMSMSVEMRNWWIARRRQTESQDQGATHPTAPVAGMRGPGHR